MGYKKPIETSKDYLENAPLPNHGQSYAVVSHKDVINVTHNLLTSSGFEITKELYRANLEANVAQGVYHLRPITSTDSRIIEEKELGMMFAWTNSYDKSARFQCAVGAHVFVCANGMISGDMMNFGRKHTGSAFQDIKVQIINQIKSAENSYKKILDDRDSFRKTILTKRSQAELLGRLYVDQDIIDITQLSAVKSEMTNPSFDYDSDSENAWTFYNHVTTALKKSHPRTWLSDSRKFHEFMVADLLAPQGISSYSEGIDASQYHIIQDLNEAHNLLETEEIILSERYILNP